MARNLAPFDPYAAIWHYLATVRTSPNAREGLEFDTLSLDRPEWPRPLVEMLLGHMAPYKLWALAADDDAGRQETKRCEAAYYAGEAFELVGKSGDALLRYQKARRICPKTLIEYAAAQAGLERMRP